MPVATYRGERTVSEVTDKFYKRLTPRQREKAEAAILKANPQLKNIRTLPKGTILHMPDLPELRAKTNRNLENPEAQIAKDLAGTLNTFSKHFTKHVKVEQETTKAQSQLLESTKFMEVISNASSLLALAEEATKALDTRSKGFGERQNEVKKAISQALKDLETSLG